MATSSQQMKQDVQIKSNANEDLAYYETRREQGWEDPNNMKILTEWIHYAAVYLDILSQLKMKLYKVLRQACTNIRREVTKRD